MIAAASLVVAFIVAPVAADEPSDDDRVVAQEAFARGMEQRAHGDLLGSLTSFKHAHERLPSPVTGLELGRAYSLVGKLMVARRELDAVVRSTPKPTESSTAKRARAEAADLLRDVTARVPRIDIEITGARDTEVTIDGATVPQNDLDAPCEVDPGTHHIAATRGGLTSNRTIEIAEGERRTISFVFGASDVSSYDLDGSTMRRTSPWVYGALIAGGTGIGIGAIAGIVALSDKGSLGCVSGRCSGSQSDIDGLNRATTISTISFGVGLAGLGLGLYGLIARAPVAEPTKTSFIEPWIGIGSIGFAGRF